MEINCENMKKQQFLKALMPIYVQVIIHKERLQRRTN
jgi:hypothetical protein